MHLSHVYRKLDIASRAQLSDVLGEPVETDLPRKSGPAPSASRNAWTGRDCAIEMTTIVSNATSRPAWRLLSWFGRSRTGGVLFL